MTAARDDSAGTEAVVRKPPRKEPAGSEARLLPARYGDLIGAMTAAGQLGVPSAMRMRQAAQAFMRCRS
jgi:hypothetical protein